MQNKRIPHSTSVVSDPVSSHKLSTMQRNALCLLFGRKDFTPEEVARLEYAQVERTPKIGRKSIETIRLWLQGYGYDLSNLPHDHQQIVSKRLQSRLESAIRLLSKHGYRIEQPGSRPIDKSAYRSKKKARG